MPLCLCGCGKETNKSYNYKGYSKYIRGHNGRKELEAAKLCECGCGEYAKPGNRFIFTHHLINKSDEHLKNMSIGQEKAWANPDHNYHSKERSEKITKELEERWSGNTGYREIMIEVNTGRKCAEEARRKLIEYIKIE